MNRPLLIGLVLATAWIGLARPVVAAEKPNSTKKVTRIRLVIDYGDGVEKHFTKIPFRPGMTVLDVLLAAQSHPRGIRIQSRGKGSTAFVTGIDNLKNEGRGRNWIYRVSGKLADRSCGVQTVKQGDTILWRFGKYR